MVSGKKDAGSRSVATRARVLARAATLAAWAMASRLLGLVRDLVMAWLLGASGTCDALVAALLLPHALRKLLAEGVLSLPFTAAVVAATAHSGRERAANATRLLSRKALAGVLPAMVAVALTVLLLFTVGAAPLISLLDGRDAHDSAWLAEAAILTRLAAPYLALALFSGLVMGLLHVRGAYGQASAAPVVFNLAMLLTIGLALLGLGPAAPLMAAGFSVAGAAQLAWLTACLARAEKGLPGASSDGLAARAVYLRLQKGFARLPSVLIAASSLPLTLFAAMVPASLAGEGCMAALYFADRLLELPIGIVGACTGIAVLPGLSLSAARHDAGDFGERLSFALRAGLLFSLPAMAGLFVVAPCLCSVLLGHGSFTDTGAAATAMALRCLAPALPAAVALRSLIAACHAAGVDRLAWGSSLAAAALTLAAGLALRPALPPCLEAMAGPIAIPFALWAQCLVLYRGARRFARVRAAAVLLAEGARLCVCAVVAGLVAAGLLALLGEGLLALLAACALGVLGWLCAVRVLLPADFRLLCSLRRARDMGR